MHIIFFQGTLNESQQELGREHYTHMKKISWQKYDVQIGILKKEKKRRSNNDQEIKKEDSTQREYKALQARKQLFLQ